MVPFRRLCVALLAATTLACAESSTEPGPLRTLPAIAPRLVLPPGTTPASFGLVIDTIEVQLHQIDTTCWGCDVGHPDTLLSDTLIAWPDAQESLALRYVVTEPPGPWVYLVYMYFRSGGGTVFSGSAMVDFRFGNIHLPVIPMYYSGPGSNADEIQLAPGDTGIATIDTLQFGATAYSQAVALDTAYISWRVSDTTKARIDHHGRLTLRAGALGSSFLVIAAIPNGVSATTRVSVPNTVATLQKVAGDSQSVPIGQLAATPLVVRAIDANGKPVAGARIRFFPTVALAYGVSDSVVFTDPQGLARSAPAPTLLGPGVVRAQLTGTANSIDFTVTGLASLNARILFAGDSGASGFQLYRADPNGLNRIQVGFLSNVGIEFTAPRWNKARSRLAYTSYNANAGLQQINVTTAIGDTTAILVADRNGFDPKFEPTGKDLAYWCNSDPTSLAQGDVCVVQNVNAALPLINGLGNGAGTLVVSSLVPSRPTGPGAFAWRPDASTRIAFVRDSVVDTLTSWTASRIYQVNANGTGLLPLTPVVIDAGNGPLRIEGTMDWSPDGTTIVFSAWDSTIATGGTAGLYLLNVATGTVRQITQAPHYWIGDVYPRFSPDGQRVLFQRMYYNYSGGPLYTDFYVVRVSGGGPSRITWDFNNWGTGWGYGLGGDWAPDGNSVVVTAPNGLGGRAAYRVPLDTYSSSDYLARRVLVGTAGIAGLNDHGVSWLP